MFDIIGNYNTGKVFTNNIDQTAQEQIKELCDQKAYKNSQIRIMPDVHAGKGCVIGTTMTLQDKVCPNLVGVDIGCGLLSVNLPASFNNCVNEETYKLLDSIIKEHIPSGFSVCENLIHSSEFEEIESLVAEKLGHSWFNNFKKKRAEASIGTLGGGNHFIEFGKDSSSNYWLTVHTGSRGIGKDVAEFYQRKAEKNCKENVPKHLKYLSGELMQEYILAMSVMQEYASINRKTIINTILHHLCDTHLKYNDHIETVHNYIDTKNLVLRKGAVSAKLGERLLIPMNMRDGIIIAKGKGNQEWNSSAPHGAGRLYGRNQAKQQLSLQDFENQMKGIFSTCVNEHTLDESPMAYKPMSEITSYIHDTVEIIDVIKAVYNFKAQ